MPKFITPDRIAEQLQVSLSLIYKLIRASEYAAKIQAGKRQREDVPVSLHRYLDCGFPVPKVVGKSVIRVRADEFERWMNK